MMSSSSSPACGLCMQTFTLFQRTRYTCPCCLDVVCRNCSRALVGVKDVPRAERRTCLRCANPSLLKAPEQPRDVVAFLSSGGLQLRAPAPRGPIIDTDTLDFDWVHPYPKAPQPADESARIAVVETLRVPEHLTALQQDTTFVILLEKAMAATDATMAAIYLVDGTHAIPIASSGMVMQRVPRLEALASYVVVSGDALVVADSALDLRFRAHPVATELHARGVLSIPMLLGRHVIGTMELFGRDVLPTPVPAKLQSELTALAALASGFVQNTCKTTRLSDSENSLRPRRQTAPAKIETDGSLVETMEALLTQSMRTSNYVHDIIASR
ncbi:hypothetical protein SPRG_19788 [Saprolegnia parasitica CBS 223.65]|uniref:GAF domain-containing protein n=1 Tax=Saprolegnia parasitica (strain CBS 223.65) TaxID=695850 RepID=A0A067CIB7_SAPPC|nr:hypothetical protein SPRG_19788 [Saprolegnia parasitica CBS 223.65]KDO30233.1 hypothetical protein SPRG_19788 [Saprolegnia parasitica CBS 223.65]|eukprot:XP_012199041.1 hypothetical protein SPRG_19788 [Saprolegnia parasitica CBS 223.65]